MRPDEHKKKKNAAYKKKHGIGLGNGKAKASSSADNSTNATSSSAHNDKKSKNERMAKDENRCEASLGNKCPTTATSPGHDSTGSDYDYEAEIVENKSFRRREIVSNWKKYDLESESDGTVTSRGEDFEKLLNMAGEAMSRFRFKDEIEWEGDDDRLGEGDGADQNLAGSGVLSLDIADIVSSMSCIPIHQLLGIDQNLFPVDQLESHIQSVTEKRKMYNDAVKQKDEQIKLSSFEISKCNDPLSSSTNDFKGHSASDHNKSKQHGSKVSEGRIADKSEVNNADKDKKHLVGESVIDRVVEKDGRSPPGASLKESSQSEPSLGLMDEDLDKLLDMDVGKETAPGTLEQGVTSIDVLKIESENTKCLSVSKQDAKQEVDELEGWLDDILD